MDIALWICQILLAGLFAASGYAKSTMSREKMATTGQTGAAAIPLPLVRFTATMELLAAIGLILPQATGIVPDLTVAAALGLCVVMIGAAAIHTRLHEPQNVAVNAVIFALCMFVAAGRLFG
jgi:uncharacterized membrane protein YphA (DoxX/SURF4 family)